MDRNYDVISFFSKYLYFLKKNRVAHFADLIKVAILFIKITSKSSIQLKELEIMYQNGVHICISGIKK